MGIRQALSSTFSRFSRKPQKTAHGLDAETLAKGYYGLIRSALRASVPGGWASDHYEETLHYTGWNYVAGHATALQCAGAEVEVSRPLNDDVQDAWSGKTIRKAFPRSAMHSGRERYFQAIATGRLSKSHDQGPSGDRDILPEDFGLCKLLNRPNGSQSGAHLRYEISVQLSQTGTALIVKVPNRLGKTVEMYSVPTCLMTPRPASSEFPRGAYYVSPAATRTNWADDSFVTMVGYQRLAGATIDMRDLLKISIPHPLWKDEGYSPLAAGALWSDASEQIDRARFSQFLNEARPSLIVKPPGDVNPTDNEIERVVQVMAALYTGTVNRGRIMVAPGGCDVQEANVSPKDMDYGSGFTQFRDAIMGLHGVPLIAAGITDGGSYAAFYAALKQFIMLCVQPRLDWIAEELTYQLAPDYGSGLMVRLLAASIDDPAVLESRLATDINARSITKNEQRALRGLPPRDDGEAWVGDTQTETVRHDITENRASDIAGASKVGDEQSTGISTGQSSPASQHFAAANAAGSPSIGEKRLRKRVTRLEKMLAEQKHANWYAENGINGSIPKSLGDRLDAQDAAIRSLMPDDAGDKMRRDIELAAAQTDTEPTQEQKQSGNYRKGRFEWNELPIAIESPRGAVRSGVDANGKEWRQVMPHHYGYFIGRGKKMKGADGDAVDVFIGPHPESEAVFVIDQADDAGGFDEHKVMIGFRNRSEAAQAYLAAYERGWDRLQNITTLTLPEFKDWLRNDDKFAPVSEMANEVMAKILAKRASGEWNEDDHPRGQPGNAGQFADKKPDKKPDSGGPSLSDLAQPDRNRFQKKRAEKGEMVEAKRVGAGKDAKIVLADGSDAPEHIQKIAAKIPPAWTDVKIALDPEADVQATGVSVTQRGKKSNKTIYLPSHKEKNDQLKFVRTADLMQNWHVVNEQVQRDRQDPKKADMADATWLMMEQATRPGSEGDTKGVEKLFGQPMTAKNIVLGKPDKKTAIPAVTLKFGKEEVRLKDEGARAELARRVEKNEPLFDSTFWLKSHGATTLEGRHVIQSKDGVRLQFMGKESVWHDHLIRDPELAKMLVERKEKAGDDGQLFDTNETKLRDYVADLDGGGFLSKDMRTARANFIALPAIREMPAPTTWDEYRESVMQVCKKASHVLGNAPKQCFDTYIDPAAWSSWKAGLPAEESKPTKDKKGKKELQTA